MTREEKQKRIDILRKLLIEAENIDPDDDWAASCAPPHPQWEPAVGETYYTVNDLYDIVYDYKREEGSVVYDCQLSVGNVFRTQEEGEWALERLHVLTAMQRWAGEYGDPVSIAYYENDDTVQAISALYPNRGEMVFASYEDAENCIKEVGEDRIKKYYFCLPKDDEYDAESGV